MMKKYLFLAAIIGMLFTACKKGEDFLDKTETTDLNEASTFADSARTMQFLNRIYSDVGFSADPRRFGGSIGIYSIGDESEMQAVGATQWNVIFQTGVVSALQIPTDAWDITYANIRRVNILLSHLQTTPLSAALKSKVEGEARFLRAWYYFILLKHYAGIPLIGDKVFTSDDEVPGKRNTYEECVDYIESECQAAANLLPPAQIGLDYGRITKGACLALRSRLLLYAASPLFNGRTDAPEKLAGVLGYPTYDKQRWKKAADAAQDVIALGQYGLYEDNFTAPGYGFEKVFNMRVNPEYILANMMSSNRSLESLWDPPSRKGSSSSFPYQELVDAFGTINGKPIADDIKSPSNLTGYDANDPYVNRDPRFAYSILYNGASRLDINKMVSPVYTYVGSGEDGYKSSTGPQTRTGYYTRKFLNDNTIASSTSSTTERCLPLIRYAEILLNKAEALNEFNDEPPAEVYDLIGQIRGRAGILPGTDGLYGLTSGMLKVDMQKVIQNERRVELAFEEHRYWDVRRWKIAENVSNKTLHGMQITKLSPVTYSYQLVDIRTPVFEAPKWYLWPIPQSEIGKSFDLEQNPGW